MRLPDPDAPPPPPGASLYPPSVYGSAPYPGAYPYYPPPPPPPKAAAGSGFPPWVWVAFGVALAGLGGKLLEGAKSKQQDIQQAMMQQMLKSMMGGAGAPPGGMPFPGAGGFPRPPTPPPSAAGKGATVDTTATAVKEAPKVRNSAPSWAGRPFGRCNWLTLSLSPTLFQPAPPPPPQAMPSTPRPAEAPKPSSSGSYFRDAEVMDAEATTSSSASSSSAGSSAGASGAQPSGGPAGMSVEMLENMMRDPNMQKLIYPYLPEGMRNPQTFEWMLKNPATRAQLETMLQNNSAFAGMAGGPGGAGFPMADALKNFDLNSPEVKEQFDAMGMKPEDVVSKIMSNPELTAAFQNPKVQAAIMDCSSNPMNITKYQDDKEIMDVFEKISGLFPGMGGPGM